MSYFNGGSTYGRKFAARHCSECGHELYANEEMICQECIKVEEEEQAVSEEE